MSSFPSWLIDRAALRFFLLRYLFVAMLVVGLPTSRASAADAETAAPPEFEAASKLLISLFSEPSAAAVSVDGRTLAIGDSEGRIVLWDVDRARAVRRLSFHDGPVAALVFDPLGSWLASAGFDGRIALWEYRTGRMVRTLAGHESWIVALRFSPDGLQLASGGYDKTVRVWNVGPADREPEIIQEHEHTVRAIAFSPDGTHLATGDASGTVNVWSRRGSATEPDLNESARWHLDTSIQADSGLTALAYSPDGNTLVGGSAAGDLIHWNQSDRNDEFNVAKSSSRRQGSAVTAISWASDGTALMTAGRNGDVFVWPPDAESPVAQLEGHADEVRGLALLPGIESMLTVSLDRTVRVWRAKIPPTARLSVVERPNEQLWSLALSPDGGTLFAGGLVREVRTAQDKGSGAKPFVGGRKGQLAAIDLATRHTKQSYEGFPGSVDDVAVSPDGSRLAACGWKETVVLLWNADTGEELYRFESDANVRCVCFSPDSEMLLAGCEDGNVKVWNAKSGELEKTIGSGALAVYDLAFSADGEQLAAGIGDWKTAQPGSVVVWNVADWGEAERIKQHDRAVRSVACLRNGTIVAGGEDGKVILRRRSGAMLAPLASSSGIRPMAVSPDERYLAAGLHDGTISLWDLDLGEVIQRFRPEDEAFAVAFNQEGTMLLSVSGEARIEIWPVRAD